MNLSPFEYFVAHQDHQLQFLEKMVLQNSYTADKQGVDSVGQTIERELEDCKMVFFRDQQASTGDNLVFKTKAAAAGKKALLLVGHMDTVFPPDSSFNWFRGDGQKLYGPGVIDMKGGLAVAVYTIKSLYHSGLLSDIPLTLLCNADEETGSLNSTKLIQQEANSSALALVFECGGLHGEIVTGRKGKTGYKIVVNGKAGHAAFAETRKASAILELAYKIPLLEQLNDPQKKLTVNVGAIAGGIGPNTVATQAEALIDVRYINEQDKRDNKKAIEKICNHCATPGTNAELHVISERPPMKQSPDNLKLYKYIKQHADRLDINICNEIRNGVSDANTIAACSIPVVDGLGPIGDCDHSDREYMIKSSLVDRTRLAIDVVRSLSQSIKNGHFYFKSL